MTIIVADTVNINAIIMTCIKLFAITISLILWLIFSLVNCDLEQRFLDSIQHPTLAKLAKMRCTRRFSPGVCMDNVAPVWTFVFLQQNCTERLGCQNNYHRTNRFRSYRMCMKQCRMLVEMYLKMVEFEERHADSNYTFEVAGDGNGTDDRNLRGGYANYITASGFQKDIPVILEDLSEDSDEEEYTEGEQDTRFVVYKDSNVNEDIMTVDIDYVPEEIKSEMGLLRY